MKTNKYEEILNSLINGQKRQAKQQIKKLSLDDRLTLVELADSTYPNYVLEIVKICILRDFK